MLSDDYPLSPWWRSSMWGRFAAFHLSEPRSGEDWRQYVEEFDAQTDSQKQLLVVAISHFGVERFRILAARPWKELDGKTPLECLQNPELHPLLQRCFMRLFC